MYLNLIATSYDSESELFEKYPESVQVLSKLKQLNEKKDKECCVKIYHRVDATRIVETLPKEAMG